MPAASWSTSRSATRSGPPKLASELAGGALFEIRAEHEYPYDYRECVEVSKEELTSGARPELAVEPGDLSGVEAVILCYPCWCGTMPMPVWTFLEGCDLAGKRILPMCTNEGSGHGPPARPTSAVSAPRPWWRRASP